MCCGCRRLPPALQKVVCGVFQAEETALYLATERGHGECVRVLLQADCNPNIVTLVELPLHPPSTQSGKVIHFLFYSMKTAAVGCPSNKAPHTAH